ncbi:MAG: hypothetical protein WBA57_05645 [Elainellaceae cyanobacterium]
MTDTLNVFIDLNQAGLDLDSEELEAYTLNLANEMKDGLVEEASPVRAADLPEGAKGAGFDMGFLKAEVNFDNFTLMMNWLGERIYGRTLTIEYGDVKLEYRTDVELEKQITALKDISQLKIRIIDENT